LPGEKKSAIVVSQPEKLSAATYQGELMEEEQRQLLERLEGPLETSDTSALTRVLSDQRSSDIAAIVEVLDNEQRRLIFDVLDTTTSAEVLEKVDQACRAGLFELLEEEEIGDLVAELDPDDAADLLAELPEQTRQRLLRRLAPDDAAEITELMTYSEDSAGGIMDPVLISVPDNATVAEAINKIRSAEIDEDFYSVFVVDDDGKFIGDVRIRDLLTRPEDMRVSELTDRDSIYMVVQDDQERARNVFRDNDLIVVPVLDEDHILVGRITADRIIEVADEEAAEDMYAMAGTDPDELDTSSIFHAAGVRMTWLSPCLIGTGITALVMMFFKSRDPVIYVAAAAFVPMIAAISGNAGLQTSTIVVSGLATGRLAALRLSQVFNREFRIALLVALSCGALGGVACAMLINYRASAEGVSAMNLTLAFSFAMVTAIMVATTLGLFLPFLFRRIGIDPAISSGPLVTTANDSISVAIYMILTVLLAA
jgi:magnesium transporter